MAAQRLYRLHGRQTGVVTYLGYVLKFVVFLVKLFQSRTEEVFQLRRRRMLFSLAELLLLVLSNAALGEEQELIDHQWFELG